MEGKLIKMSEDAKITVQTDGWTRFFEVLEYATLNGITDQEAIRLLVNSGLSHQ